MNQLTIRIDNERHSVAGIPLQSRRGRVTLPLEQLPDDAAYIVANCHSVSNIRQALDVLFIGEDNVVQAVHSYSGTADVPGTAIHWEWAKKKRNGGALILTPGLMARLKLSSGKRAVCNVEPGDTSPAVESAGEATSAQNKLDRSASNTWRYASGCALLAAPIVGITVLVNIASNRHPNYHAIGSQLESCAGSPNANIVSCSDTAISSLQDFPQNSIPSSLQNDVNKVHAAITSEQECSVSLNGGSDTNQTPDLYDAPAGCPVPPDWSPSTDPVAAASANTYMHQATKRSLEAAIFSLEQDLAATN